MFVVCWTQKLSNLFLFLGSSEPNEDEVVDEETRRLLLPTPHVHTEIGNGVTSVPEESQAIIFIFGRFLIFNLKNLTGISKHIIPVSVPTIL